MAKTSTSKRERLRTPTSTPRKARHAACRMRRKLSDITMKPEPGKRLQFYSRCGDFVWFSSPAATTRPTVRTMRAPVAFSATARTARRDHHRFEAKRRSAAAVAAFNAATYDATN